MTAVEHLVGVVHGKSEISFAGERAIPLRINPELQDILSLLPANTTVGIEYTSELDQADIVASSVTN